MLDHGHKLMGAKRTIFMPAFQIHFMGEEIVSTWGNPIAKRGSPSTILALHIPSDGVSTTSQGSHPTVKQFLETLWF